MNSNRRKRLIVAKKIIAYFIGLAFSAFNLFKTMGATVV